MAGLKDEIKLVINQYLVDNNTNSVTPGQLNAILTQIVDAAFFVDEEYIYPASVETLNVQSPSLGLTVDGQKVVGSRGDVVGYVPEKPTVQELATALNALIQRLEQHGLITGNP